MYDIVGKIWGAFFGIFIMFFGCLTLFALKQDTVIQNVVDNAATTFVDVSRVNGCITLEQYSEFVNTLDSTKNVYDVKILHYKENVSIPDSEEDYRVYYDTIPTKEILDVIANNTGEKTYMLRPGDFLRVEVKNKYPTLGRKLLGMIIGFPNSEGGQILASYGGYIGNDHQQRR